MSEIYILHAYEVALSSQQDDKIVSVFLFSAQRKCKDVSVHDCFYDKCSMVILMYLFYGNGRGW